MAVRGVNDTILARRAESFSRQLADLTSAFTGTPVAFRALTRRTGERVVVEPCDPVEVTIDGRALLSLEIKYLCRFDHVGEYLAVHDSTIKVHAGPRPKGDPLFRYEYVHDQSADLPAAHIHVHAHRDQFTAVMERAGHVGHARRQAKQPGDFEVARMAGLHFPVGGHRFRPGLEDVLQMLHVEFGADVGPDWESTLRSARETYRRNQTGAVVRDCPREAIRVLRELGCHVDEPDGGLQDRVDRLQAF